MALEADIVTALNLSARTASQVGSENANSPTRIPFAWTSDFREAASVPPLEMRVNPESVQFVQPKRIRKQYTQKGVVFFHFSDDRGRDLDILTLRISGRTGRLAALRKGPTVQTMDRLKAWYNFWMLSREPMADTRTGKKNLITCTYRSILFPTPIYFRGHFDQALDFQDTAADPHIKSYSASFSVHETQPDLDRILGDFNTSVASFASLVRDETDRSEKIVTNQNLDLFDINLNIGLPGLTKPLAFQAGGRVPIPSLK